MKKIPVWKVQFFDVISFILCWFIAKEKLDYMFLTRSWPKRVNKQDHSQDSTPVHVADWMVDFAQNEMKFKVSKLRILEPSFGHGNILRRIDKWFLHCTILGVEIDKGLVDEFIRYFSSCRNTLVAAVADFLQLEGVFDLIFMNPPYKDQQYITHFYKAYSLLEVGGMLVMLLPDAVRYRLNDRDCALHEFLQLAGAKFIEMGDSVCGYTVEVNIVILKKISENDLDEMKHEYIKQRLRSQEPDFICFTNVPRETIL